ncbi:hypothetical protein N9356_01500 [Porticoccaceae bacterium]|jgi:hypothetical protein|nr:hypothetical protein [Porticoccaceae bacterium]MDA8898705.1 hypothetical protein [Porticoccaceae bacterium]MDB3925804.1 hypothetical protein [Porticoccaceae bacterium]
MKIFKFLLVTVTSFLFFFSQSAFSAYDVDDVANDDSEKTVTHGAEVEINEFVLLDAMPNVELYYYPYSANDADAANTEDVPGGAGSVFVGGGVIKWHANVDTTISIDDFTFTHTDGDIDQLNEVQDNDISVYVDHAHVNTAASSAQMVFDYSRGSVVADMSADMQSAYTLKDTDNLNENFAANNGYTDYAVKYYFAVSLAEAGSVQVAGTYQASATVRAIPTVSN